MIQQRMDALQKQMASLMQASSTTAPSNEPSLQVDNNSNFRIRDLLMRMVTVALVAAVVTQFVGRRAPEILSVRTTATVAIATAVISAAIERLCV